MEDLQRKHRQEQKDLQSRVTQKRKSATKKTRKGVNDECSELERQLKEKHENELAALAGEKMSETPVDEVSLVPHLDEKTKEPPKDLNNSMSSFPLSSNPIPSGHPKKQNRQKARLARRATEQSAAAEEAGKEAANLPNLRDQERKSMLEAYTSRGLKEQEIRSDGHCLYAAVADQLEDSKIGLRPKIKFSITLPEAEWKMPATRYKATRQVAAAYISQHPDDFVPFLEQPLEEYVNTIRDTGEWGGHLEILALAKAYGVDIHVLQGNGKVETIECGFGDTPSQLWLAYYRHSFGLGEHYNSLRGPH
ncbi:hypothetical protein MMC28_007407 [Mycoblastus sanguinarius]|nr:hypothetical protein [Mycoblastus sanguinarius]